MPAETQEALEDAHSKHIGLVRAQAKYNQDMVEVAYEAATQEAEAARSCFTSGAELFTRDAEKKCKPGENVFIKDESGE